MKKLKKMAKYQPAQLQETKKTTDWKKMIKPAVIVIAVVAIASIYLNFTRIEYLFGKKDPVATVQGKPITTTQFKSYFVESNFGMQQLTGSTALDSLTAASDIKSFMESTLGSLVDDYVQAAKANDEGIKLSSTDMDTVNKAYNTAVNGYKANTEYAATLAKVNISETDFLKAEKDFYKNNQIIDKLKYKIFDEYKDTMPQSDLISVRARSIIMQLGTTTHKDADVKKAAAEALAMLKSGATMDQVIQKYSKYVYNYSSTNKNNGDMGWFTAQDVPKSFADKVFAIEPGHFSDVIQNSSACSIVYVLEKKTLDKNNLTNAQKKNYILSDKFKTYYDDQLNKWRNQYKAYTYVTTFEMDEK